MGELELTSNVGIEAIEEVDTEELAEVDDEPFEASELEDEPLRGVDGS